MNLIHRIKYKFSEPYRIKIGVGLSPIRSKRELKALITFCYLQLEEDHININHERKLIFETTIDMYNEDDIDLYRYIHDNIGFYWS